MDFSTQQIISESLINELNRVYTLGESKTFVLVDTYFSLKPNNKKIVYSIKDINTPVCRDCSISLKPSRYKYCEYSPAYYSQYITCHYCFAPLNIILNSIEKSMIFFDKMKLDKTNMLDVHHMIKVLEFISTINKSGITEQRLTQVINLITPEFPTSLIF